MAIYTNQTAVMQKGLRYWRRTNSTPVPDINMKYFSIAFVHLEIICCMFPLKILQHDMWNVADTDRLDWAGLRADIKKHGVRNSLLLAPMPTASTAQILGNNEAIEPYTSNIYTRRVLSGEFQVNISVYLEVLVS